MKLLAFVVCFLTAKLVVAIPDISIDDSYVPSIKYEISALLDLKKAYQLFPDNEDSRMERFLDLYAEEFTDTVWSVADGCTYLYLPEDHLSVRLKVGNGSDVEFVKIFGTKNIVPPTAPPTTLA